MNTKSKYEQHGAEILELYEKGKNSSEIAKILGRKYRIKFSKSSIRSFKRFAATQEQEKVENAVHEEKQEQVTQLSTQSKETIENLLYLFTEMDEIYSKQTKNALLQEKYLKNLANLETKYEDSVEKHAILNDTLHEIIIQNKEERRKKIMFTMAKVKDDNKSGNNFMFDHLSSNDYYSENEKIVGYWHGKLAEAFGISENEIAAAEFVAIQKNENPWRGGKLTPAVRKEIITIFRFPMFGAKISIHYGSRDERSTAVRST